MIGRRSNAWTGKARPAWPPRKEDLRRLYVEEKLSAAKIAGVYGLKHARVKTAESTVLHHLKKNGIRRRDPAEHIRMYARKWSTHGSRGTREENP